MHRWRLLKTLYTCELVHLLRDRHSLIYSIAIPIFLYPTILFCFFQLMTVVRGWNDRLECRLVLDDGGAHPLLRELLEEDNTIQLVDLSADPLETDEDGRRKVDEERIKAQQVDAVLRLQGDLSSGQPFQAHLLYSSVRDPSAVANARVGKILETYRDRLLADLAVKVNGDQSMLEVIEVIEEDVASGEKKANYILSLTMPLLMVIILLMGAFYPAIDATTGERERATLETTLVAPVSRFHLVLGKYFAVVTMALLAFVLNFVSMTFCFKHLLVQIKIEAFTISFTSVLVILAGATLLAMLIAALMMAVAFMARSFKEGQSYMAPIYLIGLAPVMVTLSPGIEFTPLLASLPIVNITMLFREVLQARFDWLAILFTLCSSILWTALAIWVAGWIVSQESFLFGERQSIWQRMAQLRKRGAS